LRSVQMRAISGTVRVYSCRYLSIRCVSSEPLSLCGNSAERKPNKAMLTVGGQISRRARIPAPYPIVVMIGCRPSPAWASSQFEGGDAEHALKTDGADRPGIHARGLEHRRKAMILR